MAPADFALVGGDAADVVGVLADQVGVEVVERAAHVVGVLLVHAKDDGLCKSIGISHELRQVTGDGLRARPQGDDALEILGLVLTIWKAQSRNPVIK